LLSSYDVIDSFFKWKPPIFFLDSDSPFNCLNASVKILLPYIRKFFDIEFFKYFFRVLHEASGSWLKLCWFILEHSECCHVFWHLVTTYDVEKSFRYYFFVWGEKKKAVFKFIMTTIMTLF
jgi:hypothetical protein